MLPYMSFVDTTNTRGGNIVFFGQNSTPNPIFSCKSNLSDNQIGQFGTPHSLSSMNKSSSESVSGVFFCSTPLKVLDSVIRPYSILMVNVGKIKWILNICLSYEPVSERLPHGTSYIKPVLKVPACVSRFYKLACCVSTTSVSLFTPNSSVFCNKVSSISIWDYFHLPIVA